MSALSEITRRDWLAPLPAGKDMETCAAMINVITVKKRVALTTMVFSSRKQTGTPAVRRPDTSSQVPIRRSVIQLGY